jgi:2-polyprenyl-6-hydroxyphenyl methylase/3-demethylubiquinone-9 3-methyltransferase
MMRRSEEILGGKRFAFGENWARFLALLDDQRIRDAEESLRSKLEVETLAGKSFLDVGSGSGLFSLAARRLGARVHSFDYDPQSVACTEELKRRYFLDDGNWVVEEGSVLDQDYLACLGVFDVVYSWGVLHHTGAMWRALENVVPLVKERGQLFISIYNDQGGPSARWLRVKRTYNALPETLRWLVLIPVLARIWGKNTVKDILRGKPFETWRNYDRGGRGMDAWRDVVDWVGGYPFEVAKPEQVFDFYRSRGFILQGLKTAGGSGCNEYVLMKSDQ